MLQCLILSERLQAIGRAFDQMRSQRAVQLARQQQRRASRTQPVRLPYRDRRCISGVLRRFLCASRD